MRAHDLPGLLLERDLRRRANEFQLRRRGWPVHRLPTELDLRRWQMPELQRLHRQRQGRLSGREHHEGLRVRWQPLPHVRPSGDLQHEQLLQSAAELQRWQLSGLLRRHSLRPTVAIQ